MNIGLDMMGGDFSPLEAVKGIQLYLKETQHPATLWLVGDENQVQPLLQEYSIPSSSVKVVHASQVIGMNEHPTKALKEKPQSSIAVGFQLLATGQMDAFISAGNTGAMLVGALYGLKPIEGIQRPTISTVLPKENGKTGVLLDVGLNADCKPENLNQFAILGSLYAQHILGIGQQRQSDRRRQIDRAIRATSRKIHPGLSGRDREHGDEHGDDTGHTRDDDERRFRDKFRVVHGEPNYYSGGLAGFLSLT